MTKRSTVRKEGLDALFSLLDKEVGKGAGRPLPEREIEPMDRLSLGLIGADYVTGGGLPRGRILELFGNESSGKTTLALRAMAAAQAAGGTVAYIDAEHSFDELWAAKMGVDVASRLYEAPDHGEQALSIVELMAKSQLVDLIVVDSVAALTPQAELEGDMGDRNVGAAARLMSQAMRKLTPIMGKTSIIFINQIREKIGVMFGSPETTPGGRALRFFSSIRLELRYTGQLKEGEERVGASIKLRAVKNKTAPPFRQIMVPLYYESGFDPVREVIDLALDQGILTSRGAWYYDGDTQVGKGKRSLVTYFEQPEAYDKLRARVLLSLTGTVDAGLSENNE
jgi:recombination protein RecA